MSLSGFKPDAGVRITLKLETETAEQVVYICNVAQAASEQVGFARVSLPEGKLLLEGLEGVPDSVRTVVQGLALGAYRSRQEEGWPKRITRWRRL